MDGKCAGNDVKQAMSSAGVDKKQDPFAKRGIFSNGDGFLCLICDKIYTLSMVPGHMTGNRHCTKLKMANYSYAKVDGRFACTICLTYTAADWKSFLSHLNEKNHFEELDNRRIAAASSKDSQTTDTLFSYINLLKNQIIENDSGTFFCFCCKEGVVGENKIVQHMVEKRHQKFQQTDHTTEYTGNCNENKSRNLVKHGIVHTHAAIFKCILCNLSTAGVKGCEGHIRGNEHIQNVIKRENTGNLFVLENMIEILSQSPQISPQSPQINFQSFQISSQSPSPKSPQSASSKFFDKLIRDNAITGPLPTDRYYCNLCKTTVFGYTNVFAHVYGYQHNKSIEAVGNELKLATESDKTSDGSSSSWVSTENSSESWQPYECESGSSFENSSCCWESSDNVTDSWETISIQGSSSGSQGLMPFEIPEHLIPLISTHHLRYKEEEIFCPLCDAHLQSVQSLLDHTRSKYHVAELNRYKDQIEKKINKESITSGKSKTDSPSESQGSMPFEIPKHLIPLISTHHLRYRQKEIFCPLCEAHLKSVQSLLDHTRSKYHVAELNRYKDRINQENKKESITSGKSSAASSPLNAMNKKPVTKYETGTPTQANKAEKSEGQHSNLFHIPKSLTPLISKHMLEYRKTEIYCVACEARLQTLDSLLAHTRSKYHSATLDNYKSKIAKQYKVLTDTSGRNSTSSSVSSGLSKKILSASFTSKREAGATVPKTVTKEVQPPQSKLFNIPNHLLPLLASHSLQRFEHEIFCPACHVHLRHVSNMIQHTNSQNHMATLRKYRAEISRKSQCSAKILKTNAAVNTSIKSSNEKPSNIKPQSNTTTLKIDTANPQKPKSSLMKIPKKLLPLIKQHSLKHLKNEVYCEACTVLMKDATSLVSHTSSRRHVAILESFRATNSAKKTNTETLETKLETPVRKLPSRSENTTGLESSLSKLTIEDVGQENSNKLSQNELKNIINQPPRRMKPRKQDNRVKPNRAFDPKYLKVDMQHFYEVHPEKLRKMTLSCQLCFPKTSRTVYCLICERSVGSKLQTFYEHICSSAHTVYLTEAEKNDKEFINYPDQYSDLALAREYMQEGEKETIQCLACDKSIQNEDIVILEHIEADSHKERKQLWKKAMENILQEILLEMAATWYNIQKYWCEPCDIEYNTEFHFAEHMDSKRHKNSLKKLGGFQDRLVYDSCIACATLWLGISGIFQDHCEQPMHKFLVQSGDFSVCKLPNQVKNLLENSEAEVASLIELSNQVLTVQKVNVDSLLKCLEDTVKSCYPNAKAHPLGSRVSGLGFPDSDIDVFLDCGTYDGTNNSKEYQDEVINTVEHCLYANQKLWEIEETLVTTRTPIIKIRHRKTELRCDVSFKNGLSVENTKLLKCYIDNYPPCRMLMLFLKKWLSLCNLSGSYYITNYATCWYVIFYLQRKAILPSIASLIEKENKSKIIDGWETGISERFDVDEQEFTFVELLHDFFVFYNDFDYRDSVACPLLGRSLLKQDFTELDLLPTEMAPYINHVKTKSVDGLVELFRIDSEMCIQDPYDLSHNLTKAVRKHTLNRFKRLCAESANVLNDYIQH